MPLLEQVTWAPGQKEKFLDYIQHELHFTIGDRSELERKWENNIIQWRAQLPEGDLDFPYPGASNLELPLTAMHADPVLADMVQTFHAPSDYWTPRPERGDRVPHASPFREAITALERRYLKMRNVNIKAFLYNNVLGTACYKNNWLSVRKTERRYLPDGSSTKAIRNISQPQIEHVPLASLYFPAEAWSIDPDMQGGAKWVAQKIHLTPNDLNVMAAGSSELPAFDREAVEKVKEYKVDDSRPIEDELRVEDKFEPFRDEKITVYEVWARYDADGDGIEEDIVAIIHYDVPVLLRAIYNPNAHQKRPFHVTNYLPGFGIYGIGLSEVDEWAQEAGSKLLNAQIDNVLLANTRMYAVPQGSGIQPGEDIYPSKIWTVGPNESIGEVKLSEVYPSIFQSLSQLTQFAELRSGVSELRQGNLSGLPSRTPATSLLSILQEGNKRFDMIHTGIRDVHSEMGLRMVQNVAQRVKEDPQKWMQFFGQAIGPQDTQLVMEVFMSSNEDIEESFGVTVTATSAQVNKEVEKQAFIGMLQMTQQIYGSLVQTAMLMAQVPDEIVQGTARAAYVSGVELLKRLLERFDIENPEQYLANLETIGNALNAQQQGVNPALQSLVGAGGLGVLGEGQGIPPQLLAQGQAGALGGF
jgi:hypothetical protein